MITANVASSFIFISSSYFIVTSSKKNLTCDLWLFIDIHNWIHLLSLQKALIIMTEFFFRMHKNESCKFFLFYSSLWWFFHVIYFYCHCSMIYMLRLCSHSMTFLIFTLFDRQQQQQQRQKTILNDFYVTYDGHINQLIRFEWIQSHSFWECGS